MKTKKDLLTLLPTGMILSGQMNVETTVTVEYEDATPDNSTPLMTNTISAGTPGTESYTEMTNSYTEFNPEAKTAHHEQAIPTLSEKLDHAAWIARDVMKSVGKRDMKPVRDAGLGAGDAVKDLGKSAGGCIMNLGCTGALRGLKSIGKSGGQNSNNAGPSNSNGRVSNYKDSESTEI